MENEYGMSIILLFEGMNFHKWMHTDRYCNPQYDFDYIALEAFIKSKDCIYEQFSYIQMISRFKNT